ncbi:MAG TPA: hypothetical protein VJU61_04450 [Polyangiaceae bacterium]|nr:hypothetical protein [Polyangiaceae bacterium]
MIAAIITWGVSSSAQSPPVSPMPLTPAPTHVTPAPAAPAASATEEGEGIRAVLGAGALYVPTEEPVTALSLTVGLTLPSARWENKLLLTGVQVNDTHTRTRGFVLLAQSLYAVGPVYSLGFGGGFGYMDFKNLDDGWDDDSAAAAVYVVPVALRLHPQFQLTLNTGAIRFFSHDVRPWGYLGLLFTI